MPEGEEPIPEERVDALVIGGGPGGSTAAAVLAARGLDVLVCERARFPRFLIGESLLPYNVPIFRRLGVWEQLLAHGFQHKWGGRFVFEPEMRQAEVVFPQGLRGQDPMTIHVRRAELDSLLLDNAARLGAKVWQGTAVERVRFADGRAVGASLRSDDGTKREVAARVVIDASGRNTLLGKQLGIKRRDPALRQAALFTHVRGADMALGREGGDILIVGVPFGWFWFIPLDQEVTSVGCVLPGEVMKERGDRSLDEFFAALAARSPSASARLEGAEYLRPVEPHADFSYRLDHFVGDGYAVVGDAASFLDPIFSSGVYLAMITAEKAALLAARALTRHGRVDRRHLVGYERFARRGFERFRRYILAFYDPACIATFTEEPPAPIRAPAISAFAGKVFDFDPRIWFFELAFFGRASVLRTLAKWGKTVLPTAPARDETALPAGRSSGQHAVGAHNRAPRSKPVTIDLRPTDPPAQ